MSLSQKIKIIYTELTSADFDPATGTIILQDNSDGKGVYIAKWEHPTLARPTQEQLDSVEE
jgi:hypothetical protein